MINPLKSWLDRHQPLPERFYTAGHIDTPKAHWLTWLSMEECRPLYQVMSMEWLSFRDARTRTEEYLNKANHLIQGLDGGRLDGWEQEEIVTALGEPPAPSLPIYMITCGDGKDEELVYIGKTKNTSRFIGGHSAALKLHAPDYEGKSKNIYRGTVWFDINDEYISLDWIQPENLALDILDSIESQLIYHLQPPLNTHKKKVNLGRWEFTILIQNHLSRDFMNNKHI